MRTTDVNDKQLGRGDWVVASDAMVLDDPVNNYDLGVGQIIHVFSYGPQAGIHVKFKRSGEVRIANTGAALRRLDLSEVCF